MRQLASAVAELDWLYNSCIQLLMDTKERGMQACTALKKERLGMLIVLMQCQAVACFRGTCTTAPPSHHVILRYGAEFCQQLPRRCIVMMCRGTARRVGNRLPDMLA
jgi:hypothetical protein